MNFTHNVFKILDWNFIELSNILKAFSVLISLWYCWIIVRTWLSMYRLSVRTGRSEYVLANFPISQYMSVGLRMFSRFILCSFCHFSVFEIRLWSYMSPHPAQDRFTLFNQINLHNYTFKFCIPFWAKSARNQTDLYFCIL